MSFVVFMALLAAEPAPGLGEALIANGSGILVRAGRYTAANGTVAIGNDALLPVRPSDVAKVEAEKLQLPDVEPNGFWKGALLAGPRTTRINAPNAFIADSLILRDAKTGRILTEGKDYRISVPFGLLGLGTDTDLTPEDEVLASYSYHLQRVDAVMVDPKGVARMVEGEPVITEPLPPAPRPGETCIARIYRPFGATDVHPEHVYPVLESREEATTRTVGRLPKTMAKLRGNKPVKIVCLGDSITAGGNASSPEFAYVNRFAVGLKSRFPECPIDVVNISIGGTRSSQWLHDGTYPGLPELPADKSSFDRVSKEQPDVVTVEFFNDQTLSLEELRELYADLLARVRALGAELVLITPSFSDPGIMRTTSLSGNPEAPFTVYVQLLYNLAEREDLSLADAAARWDHLKAEGLPYMTLLRNCYNHPGDRGHALYAEELLKCFE